MTDEEEKPKKKSGLFNPVKKDNMTLEEQWDLFTLKAIYYGEDDDDDGEVLTTVVVMMTMITMTMMMVRC